MDAAIPYQKSPGRITYPDNVIASLTESLTTEEIKETTDSHGIDLVDDYEQLDMFLAGVPEGTERAWIQILEKHDRIKHVSLNRKFYLNPP